VIHDGIPYEPIQGHGGLTVAKIVDLTVIAADMHVIKVSWWIMILQDNT